MFISLFVHIVCAYGLRLCVCGSLCVVVLCLYVFVCLHECLDLCVFVCVFVCLFVCLIVGFIICQIACLCVDVFV